MSTIRVARRKRFTVIERDAINDKRLSFRARGVLFWLLDKPDDWWTDSNAIARCGTEGRDAVRACLKELEDCGYLTRIKKQIEGGKWVTEVIVRERPTPENPSSAGGKPGPGKPTPESQALSTEDEELNTEEFGGASQRNENDQDPDPKCIRCHGSGELYGTEHPRRCPCTFVIDPALLLVATTREELSA